MNNPNTIKAVIAGLLIVANLSLFAINERARRYVKSNDYRAETVSTSIESFAIQDHVVDDYKEQLPNLWNNYMFIPASDGQIHEVHQTLTLDKTSIRYFNDFSYLPSDYYGRVIVPSAFQNKIMKGYYANGSDSSLYMTRGVVGDYFVLEKDRIASDREFIAFGSHGTIADKSDEERNRQGYTNNHFNNTDGIRWMTEGSYLYVVYKTEVIEIFEAVEIDLNAAQISPVRNGDIVHSVDTIAALYGEAGDPVVNHCIEHDYDGWIYCCQGDSTIDYWEYDNNYAKMGTSLVYLKYMTTISPTNEPLLVVPGK